MNFFTVFCHRTVSSEDPADVRIFVGTVHDDQLWFAEKGCSVVEIPVHVLQTKRTIV
jgi:hypothetical protein